MCDIAQERSIMSQKDFKAMMDKLIAEEEKRLGIGTKEFEERHKMNVERHNEIMGMIERARGKGA